jgi:hypothetical protein
MPLCSFRNATFAQWTAGASRRPAFPAPSALLGAATAAKLGHDVPRERETARTMWIEIRRWILLPCPGRSAALLQRCAAEPGPMHQQSVRAAYWVPALHRTATRCVASGTREWRIQLPPLRHCELRRRSLMTPALPAPAPSSSGPDCLRGPGGPRRCRRCSRSRRHRAQLRARRWSRAQSHRPL